MHNHKAQLSKRRSESWRYCVLQGRAVGAVRRSERSGRRTAYGPWVHAQ